MISNHTAPVIIEFIGLPNSGKTSVIDILEHYYCRMGFEVKVISEISSSCPITKKSRLEFVPWTSNQTINILLEQKHYNKLHDLVLIDRGIFDTQIFLQLAIKELSVQNEYKQTLMSYAGLPFWNNLVDGVFLLDVPVNLSWERDQRNRLTNNHGIIVNSETLMTMHKYYLDLFKSYENSNHKDHFCSIDTKELSLEQVATICRDKIQMLLKSKTN